MYIHAYLVRILIINYLTMIDQKSNNIIPWISSIKEISSQYDFFIFDCDGVIWKENFIFKEAVEAIKYLQEEKKNVFFLSNTNRWSKTDLQEKLKKCGLDIDHKNIYTASYLISKYIAENFSHIKHLYLIGGEGLEKELTEKGFTIYGGPEEKNIKKIDNFVSSEIEKIEVDENIQACLCGFDEKFDYFKLTYGGQVILNTGLFFGTNYDRRVRIGNKYSPGSYTFIAALEAFTERKAQIITKPDPRSLGVIMSDHGFDLSSSREKMLMIGDNFNTDIQFANNNKISSLLILTGITTEEEAKLAFKESKDNLPTYVIKKF